MVNTGLGLRIKSIRENLGKNQSEFGELFNPPAPKSAVSRWEHGGSPNKKRLAEIAKLGGMTVDELIYGTLNDSISDITNELYSLFPKWWEIVNDSDWNTFVSLAKDDYEKNNYGYISDLFRFICSDGYIPYPKFKKKITEEEKSKRIKEYRVKNLMVGIRACANIALTEAKILDVSPANKTMLLKLMSEASERHFSGETATNTGILNIVNNSLDDATNKIYAITHGFKRKNGLSEEVTYPTKINNEFLEEMDSLIEATQEKAFKIASKYNVDFEE